MIAPTRPFSQFIREMEDPISCSPPYRKKTKQEIRGFAEAMRRRPTNAESALRRALYSCRRHYLRDHCIKGAKICSAIPMFKFQEPKCGYIADFFFERCALVVEVDGGYHFDEKQSVYDARRDKRMANCGIRVMRFSNEEVLDCAYPIAREIYSIAIDRFRPKKKRRGKKRRGDMA
jgi:very-short-patch-repair endonuclease